MFKLFVPRIVFWVALFVILNAIYFIGTYRSIGHVLACCDASSYLSGADKFAADGLLADTPWPGYRSILDFAAIAGVRSVGALLHVPSPASIATAFPAAQYAAGALMLYALIGVGTAFLFSRKQGFGPAFGAIFLNPITMIYVPLPLQESLLALLASPLLVWSYVALVDRDDHAAPALTLFAATSWMIRASLLPVSALVVLLALFVGRKKPVMLALSVCLALVVVAPQSYVAMQRFGTPYPYPSNSLLASQMAWAQQMWKHETLIQMPASTGIKYPTPFHPVASQGPVGSLLQFVATSAGHVVAAFDYTHPKVYSTEYGPPRLSLINVVVGAALALAISQWAATIVQRRYHTADALLDAVVAGNLAVLPFAAVELRFALPAAMALAVRALKSRPPLHLAFMAVAFGFFFATATLWLNQLAAPL